MDNVEIEDDNNVGEENKEMMIGDILETLVLRKDKLR